MPSKKTSVIAKVIPFRRLPWGLSFFDYTVPSAYIPHIQKGSIVKIPFKASAIAGVVAALESHNKPPRPLKPILSFENTPPIDSRTLDMADWFARYYCVSHGMALVHLFPTHEALLVHANAHSESVVRKKKKNTAPRHRLVRITTFEEKQRIYSSIIARCRQEGTQALFLCPTFQDAVLLASIIECIAPGTASLLSSKQKRSDVRIHRELLASKKRLFAVGTRSAIFASLPALSLIVVDQAERAEFKNYDHNPRYDARTVAWYVARAFNIQLLFVSVAPRLEEYATACAGLIQKNEPTGKTAALPVANLSDARKTETHAFLSSKLIAHISDALEQKKDIFLFLDRKGWSSKVICTECGYLFQCHTCSHPLQSRDRKKILFCTQCKTSAALEQTCPSCHGVLFSFPGVRIEKVLQALEQLFPAIPLYEGTRETLSRHILSKLRATLRRTQRQPVIVLGTSHILDVLPEIFSRLGLCALIAADPMYSLHNFRFGEEQWQRAANILYRALSAKSTVLIQAFQPSHPFIQSLSRLDYEAFAQSEYAQRVRWGFPPAVRMIRIFRQSSSLNDMLPHLKKQNASNAVPIRILEESSHSIILSFPEHTAPLDDPLMQHPSLASCIPYSVLIDRDPLFR